MNTRRTQDIGQEAEQIAAVYLQRAGLRLIERNFRCKLGEIDLIMQDAETLVFVEVRFRQQTKYGSGAATVSWHKQQRLIKAAQYYLQKRRAKTPPCRFDVLSMTQTAGNFSVDWIKNAFESF